MIKDNFSDSSEIEYFKVDKLQCAKEKKNSNQIQNPSNDTGFWNCISSTKRKK